MSQSRVEPSDPIRASKFCFLEKPWDVLSLFARLALLSFLVASILFVLNSSFSTNSTQWLRFPTSTRVEDAEPEPTNISHILFGLGGSAHTWYDRSRYSSLWWDANTTRGFVWLDKKPDTNTGQAETTIPYRVSEDWTRFKYSSSQSAVRIARIVLESFKLGLPNVRWFVMGDDDTVYFTENLVSVLGKYDHKQMYYIGGNSESVEQDLMHRYDMAFGGGGFAISYPLAMELVKILDGCLDRYYFFYGSDQRIWACISEIGVGLTLERGFHQLDIRGDPYGLLSAHPLSPLVSLHHLDSVNPIFPKQTQLDSLASLFPAYRLDPPRILQQSFCHDHHRRWSISISWGYSAQIYPSLLPAMDLQTPLQTFKTWRSWGAGPFTFNARPVESDPCKRPAVFFLDGVEEVGKEGTLSSYKRAEVGKRCNKGDFAVQKIVVFSMKMEAEYWKNAPRRQCCEIMDQGSINDSSIRIMIRKCRAWETVTI